jgi:hypothetical protein
VSENGFTINKSDALNGISSTVSGNTNVKIVLKGAGKQTVSSSFTSSNNSFTAALQVVHALFMVAKNVSLAVRQDPEIYENFVSNAVAKDYVMWTVADEKVYRDQAPAIIDLWVRCDATSFSAYSNVHA